VAYPKKNYMIEIFISHRILSPKKMKNSQNIFDFWQKLEVWYFHQSSNLTYVVTKW